MGDREKKDVVCLLLGVNAAPVKTSYCLQFRCLGVPTFSFLVSYRLLGGLAFAPLKSLILAVPEAEAVRDILYPPFLREVQHLLSQGGGP